MNKSIISEGKTSTEAINNGLKQLGCSLKDVDVKILENEDKKVFFSILDPRIVKVELTVKENIIKKNNEEDVSKVSNEDIEKFKYNLSLFLDKFTELYGNIQYNINVNSENFVLVSIDGEDAFKLIGYRGEVINSLQILLSSIGNKNVENRVRVIVDIADYKEKREKTLIELASKLEKTVIRTKKKIVLEPMNAYDRKIIHSALQNSGNVSTYSIGEEPHRKVVVDIKK